MSNLGRIKNLKSNKILKPIPNNYGYLRINLYKNNKIKQYKIHRLVAYMFIPNNDKSKIEINHLDENKENNNMNNLEWCDRKENVNYGSRNKKSSEKISKSVICINTGEVYKSTLEAEKKTGINSQSISSCCLFYSVNCDKEKWYKFRNDAPRKSAGKHPITKEKLIWNFYKMEE